MNDLSPASSSATIDPFAAHAETGLTVGDTVMRWTGARLGVFVIAALATSAHASSGDVRRIPVGSTKLATAFAPPCPSARSVPRKGSPAGLTAEIVITGLIGAGEIAWNSTLGGIMPAPELVLKRIDRA